MKLWRVLLKQRKLLFPIYLKNVRTFRQNFSSEQYASFVEQVDDFIHDSIYDEIKEELTNLKKTSFLRRGLVVQPRPYRAEDETAVKHRQYLLEETIALVKTLPNWSVEGVFVAGCKDRKTKIFGRTNLEALASALSQRADINAIVVSMSMLSGMQQQYLEKELNISVYDRYAIILQVFQEHATSGEAKIQMALAEIGYIFARIQMLHQDGSSKNSKFMPMIGGYGRVDLETRKKLLNSRKQKLVQLLERIGEHRDLQKNNRIRKGIPTVAVVGYTNSGKTTLIKALTNDKQLVPKDALFATLNVTLHETRLPSCQQVLFADTIGFVTDAPTELLGAFRATLKDIVSADLLVHVFDVSNPGVKIQIETVKRTLEQIKVPPKLLNSMITVANKTDLLEDLNECELHPAAIPISAVKLKNLTTLLQKVDESIVENTGRFTKRVRVKTGHKAYTWLVKETTIIEEIPDQNDCNYVAVKAVFTIASYNRFVSYFCTDNKV